MTQRKRSFVGRGIVRLAQTGTGRYFDIGNCSKLELSHNEKTLELPDYQRSGGGTAEYYTRIESVDVSLTLRIASPDNLARCIHGDVTETLANPNQAHVFKAVKGGFSPTPFLINPAAATLKSATPPAWAANTAYALGTRIKSGTKTYQVTVAGNSAAVAPAWPAATGDTVVDGGVTWQCEGVFSATTYLAGTDYRATAGGIEIPASSGIADNSQLELTAERPGQFRIDALTHGARDWALHFDGLNEVDSDTPVIIMIPLVKFGATKNLPLIGDEFASFDMTGRILRSAEGSGEHAFYQVLQQAAA